MRRRRQKSTLLPKMIVLAVLINAILLPILAQLGVFKSIGGGQRLTPVELVKAPPPEKRPAPPKKAKKQVAKAKPAGHKAAPRTATAHRAPSGPPPVKVVAAAGGAGANGGGGDSGITTSDSGPSTPAPPAPPTNPPPATPPPPPTPPVAPAPVTTLPVVPATKPPPPPHVPTLTAAEPLAQPHPAIPDELRDADLNATFEGLFTVRADGTATVKMVSSTGNPALDSLALDAARRWTFRPATRDGQPVQSFLRLRIEFDVSS
jgi:protein TonB